MAKGDFAFLQQRFTAGLQRRVGEMNRCLDTLTSSAIDAPTAENLQRLFHSLAGIGGTFGFHEITDLAKEGEHACWQVVEDERPLDASELTQLRGLVHSIAAFGQAA